MIFIRIMGNLSWKEKKLHLLIMQNKDRKKAYVLKDSEVSDLITAESVMGSKTESTFKINYFSQENLDINFQGYKFQEVAIGGLYQRVMLLRAKLYKPESKLDHIVTFDESGSFVVQTLSKNKPVVIDNPLKSERLGSIFDSFKEEHPEYIPSLDVCLRNMV